MEDKTRKEKAPRKEKVEVLEETLEKGSPQNEDEGKWRQKLISREEKLKYLQTAERYWYGKDWYGSEQRKNPA